MSVSSSNQSFDEIASDAMTDSESLNEPGVYTFDNELEADITSRSVGAGTNDDDFETDNIFESAFDEAASNIMIDTESSDEPVGYTMDEEFETDITSETEDVSSSNQSSNETTSNVIEVNSLQHVLKCIRHIYYRRRARD